jgi:hypothetical protein
MIGVAVQPGGDNRTIQLMKVMRGIGKFQMVRRVVPAQNPRISL